MRPTHTVMGQGSKQTAPSARSGERLEALKREELLDQAQSPEFDRWTVAARRCTDATVAAFLLEDGKRMWAKSLATAKGRVEHGSEISATDPLEPQLLRLAGRRSSGPGEIVRVPVVVDAQPLGWLAVAGCPRSAAVDDVRVALEDAAAGIAGEVKLRLANREADRVRDLLAAQNAVHELIGRAAPLREVLEEIARGIERYDPSVLACVLLLDRQSGTLHPGSAPSLPPQYLAAVDGVVIGPNVGTCGAAAWSGRLTITEDIATDPKWAPIRELPLSVGLRHCWSMPIKASEGAVLGTLAFYGRAPRVPRREQLALLSDSARLAGIAIERHRTMEKLFHDARHDGLTGLANRTAIFEQLDEAITHVRRHRHVAVLFVDLDGLKILNDTFGHDRADEMLRELGGRVAAAVRPTDFVGRFGGDEFVVVAEDIRCRNDAAEIGERLLDEISKPLPGIEGAVVTASIGIAILNGSAIDAREALREADRAMYAAKGSGRDRFRFFDGEQPVTTGRHLALARLLKGAETRGEMRVVFQPVFDTADARVVAAEALLRWNSPSFGEVTPGEFIPIAEDSGAIVRLGAWVLRESCETLARIIEEAGRPIELSVNVSPRQLGRAGFAKSVGQILSHTRLPAELLTLEITETALLRPDAVTERTLSDLAALGVRIVLDDFGTGYSSLAWLKHHPLDAIKIDRSFVSGLPDDPRDEAVVAGVIGISRSLGCTVTAEGVETEEQLDALRALGCERIQGFLLARPLPANQLTALLTREGTQPAAERNEAAPRTAR